MSANDEKELKEFMKATIANKEDTEERIHLEDEEAESLPEYKDPIRKTESSGSNIDESTIETIKFVINFFIVYPLMIVILIGGGILAIKLMPYVVFLARRVIIALSQTFG